MSSTTILFAEQMMIVGIAGGTSSGKTRLAQQIQEAFGPYASLIEQDCYYKDLSKTPFSERTKTNFDHPDSLDFDLLHTHLLQLRSGQAILKPTYDFKTHSRTCEQTLVQPTKIVVVEGILLLSVPAIRDLFDLKIYVDAEDDIRILRRIERDIKDRGRDLASIKEQYLNTVKPMHMQFVKPSKIYADVIIPSIGDTSQALQLIVSRLKDVLEITVP